MVIIRKTEIQNMNKQELLIKLKELELELLKLKIQKGQASAGTKKSKEIKRVIARIYTQLNQIKK